VAGQNTLLDIAKANGSDKVVGLIDETQKAHPEIAAVPARTIKGISYKTWVRKALPVSGFRLANQGAVVDHSQYENRVVDTFLFNPKWICDMAVANAYEDGAAAFINYEAEGMIEAAMQTLAKQFYYGFTQSAAVATGMQPNLSGIYGDPSGFPGLINAVNPAYSLDAAGTTASTASSVWGIKFGEKFIQWVWGQNGSLQLTDITIQEIQDSSGSVPPKYYTAYIQQIIAQAGLQIGNLRGFGRIKNITADSGHTLTDVLLSKWFALFEVGFLPEAIFMNRPMRQQLQAQRTVTLFGQLYGPRAKPDAGMMVVAPTPDAYEGVPIMVTDALSSVEAVGQ
jgi:hypothetical protein